MTDIEEILKATIQTKVIEAFNEAPEAIEKLVQGALRKEVDQHGSKPSGRYGETKMPYMDWLVGDEIRRAVSVEVREYVGSHKTDIAKKVQEAICSADFGPSLSSTVSDVLSKDYHWNVNLNINKPSQE